MVWCDGYEANCGPNAACVPYNRTDFYCVCAEGYTSVDGFCDYKQTSGLVAFLVSFFVGEFGVDWFILARGNAGYIVAGIFKLLTAGGFGIWWLVDWIRVLCESFHDGNGVALTSIT
jgi:hypothetical protein